MSNCDVIYNPIKFLGATVLSFNTSLGLGFSESTLNVELIEDCDDGDQFEPLIGLKEVGAPVYFNAGAFSFGGVLTNWTITQGASGKTFNAQVVDPRQLLENTIVIVDTYGGPPLQGVNYFNVYGAYEGGVLQGDCGGYGDSGSGDRGMPYVNIISKLIEMQPTIFSPTGYPFTINFPSFPQDVPEFYRVPGPGISILQLLQDVCDVTGFEFYVNLLPGGIITVGGIDLKNPPPSFSTIIDSFDGIATELSYGQELRNEKTKALIFGEKQHYLSYVDQFDYFFGEDTYGEELVPVTPIGYNKSGFWISKRIDTLNASLFRPLPGNGPYKISELDIRCAMSSFDLWRTLVLDGKAGGAGTLNQAIYSTFNECATDLIEAIDNAIGQNSDLNPAAKWKRMHDMVNNASKGGAEANKPQPMIDLENIHAFVQNLGTTFYGKQWISPLKEKICPHAGENYQEKIFSSIPTNEGGWVDDGTPVLGLSEPELTAFKSEDNRINCFAIFNSGGDGKGGNNNGSIGDVPPENV